MNRVGMAQPWPAWVHTAPAIGMAPGEVGVVEHEVDRLAAQLEEHRLQGGRRPPP